MCEGDRVSRGGQGMVEVKLLCFRWLSPFLKQAKESIQHSGHGKSLKSRKVFILRTMQILNAVLCLQKKN